MGVSLFAVVVMLSALSFSMYVHCRRKRLRKFYKINMNDLQLKCKLLQ